MAGWSWEKWQQEIDWMALMGINLPLAMVGMGKVWQNTLRRMNFSEQEIFDFIPGPAFEAWWLMGNLEQWGGPVSQQYIDNQYELQKKILQRMRELGMQPILQGFYGMVPNLLVKKMPQAKIYDQGQWDSFHRPAFLDPNDEENFFNIANIYYEELEKLYGRTKFYGGDPFHEGGKKYDININVGAKNIYKALVKNNPKAIWVLQGWQRNPRNEILESLQQGQILILDLSAENYPKWSDQQQNFKGHDWIWCALINYGDKYNMHGNFQDCFFEPIKALKVQKNYLKGIGMTIEGNSTNPINYELIYDNAWQQDVKTIKEWVKEYITYRYGSYNDDIYQAWCLLAQSVYNNNQHNQGPMESIICARPKFHIYYANEMTKYQLKYYNDQDVFEAWILIVKNYKQFQLIDTFQYDLVDITRQVLVEYAQILLNQLSICERQKDIFQKTKDQFLELILDLDTLLGTRKEFLLGAHLKNFRQMASTEQEAHLFEQNLKRLITTWSYEDTWLHEYAARQWNGLIKSFYYNRWKNFFDNDCNYTYQFNWEDQWVQQKEEFQEFPLLNPIDVSIEKIYKKYIDSIKQFIYLQNKEKNNVNKKNNNSICISF